MITVVLCTLGCADKEVVESCVDGHKYHFWGGLWHGLIAPFGFVGSLIWPDTMVMYAPNNNGGWYAFRFLLGSGGWGILAGRASDK